MRAPILRRGAVMSAVVGFVVVMTAMAVTAGGDPSRPRSPPSRPPSSPPSKPPSSPPPSSKAGGEGIGRPPKSGHCSNEFINTNICHNHCPAPNCTGTGETCRNDLCFCAVSDAEWRWNRCVSWKTGNINCTPVDSDPANCGACNHACPASQMCNHGKCTACGKGTTRCGNGDAQFDHCADLMSSDVDCGKCGHQCPGGLTCVRGHCER